MTEQQLIEQRDMLAAKFGTSPKHNAIVPEEILAHIRHIIAYSRQFKSQPNTHYLMVPGWR